MLTHLGTSPKEEENDLTGNPDSIESLLLGEFQPSSQQLGESGSSPCLSVLSPREEMAMEEEVRARPMLTLQSGVEVPQQPLEQDSFMNDTYLFSNVFSKSEDGPGFDLSHYVHQSLVDDSLSSHSYHFCHSYPSPSAVSLEALNDTLDSPLDFSDCDASSPSSTTGWQDHQTICPSDLGSPHERLYEVLGLSYEEEKEEGQGSLFPARTPIVEEDKLEGASFDREDKPLRESPAATRRSARRGASKTPYSPPPSKPRTERTRDDDGKRLFTGHRSASSELLSNSVMPLEMHAPIQTRKYLIPSSTSRKALPVAVSRIRPFRSLATTLASTTPSLCPPSSRRPHNSRRPTLSHPSIDEIELQEDAALTLPKEVIQVVKKKREQNTLAARKSRERKQKYLDELEEKLQSKDDTIASLEKQVKKLKGMLGLA